MKLHSPNSSSNTLCARAMSLQQAFTNAVPASVSGWTPTFARPANSCAREHSHRKASSSEVCCRRVAQDLRERAPVLPTKAVLSPIRNLQTSIQQLLEAPTLAPRFARTVGQRHCMQQWLGQHFAGHATLETCMVCSTTCNAGS